MHIFGTDSSAQGDVSRGCFVAFDLDTAGSKGAVLQLPGGAGTLPDRTDPAYPLVVTGVSFNQNEIAQFLKCFGGRIYTYAFGNDLGDLKVDFVGFLAGGVQKKLDGGAPATTFKSTSIIKDFCQVYKKNRLSISKQLAILSVSGSSLQGLIVGMQSATMSSDSNLQAFSLVLKLVEVQGGALPPGAAGAGSTPPAAAGGADQAAQNNDYQSGFESGEGA